MTPKALADLHTRAMPEGRGWNATAFAGLLDTPGIFLTLVPSSLSKYAGGGEQGERGAEPPTTATRDSAAQDLAAFALGRVTLDEAELLTLAVHPDRQRRGLGRLCLTRFETDALERGATRGFLEVAAANHAARALYRGSGWQEDGTRPGYYPTGTRREDAILMSKTLKPT